MDKNRQGSSICFYLAAEFEMRPCLLRKFFDENFKQIIRILRLHGNTNCDGIGAPYLWLGYDTQKIVKNE